MRRWPASDRAALVGNSFGGAVKAVVDAWALAAALPSARHVSIPGPGHLAPLEAPEAFRELVLEFLAQPPS